MKEAMIYKLSFRIETLEKAGEATEDRVARHSLNLANNKARAARKALNVARVSASPTAMATIRASSRRWANARTSAKSAPPELIVAEIP